MRFVLAAALLISAVSVHADDTRVYMLKNKAQELVKERLKDADSAKFQKLSPHTLSNGGIVICGEVNSKNKYGGYTGFQKFYSTGESVRFREDAPSTFDGVYQMVCSK